MKYIPYNGNGKVFVSDLLKIDPNNCGIIRKPFVDYQEMKPIWIEKHFNKTNHRFNVHRYIRFCYFNQDELVFIPLDKWEDPYETLAYVGNDINNNLNIQLACMCCTYERVEGEEASWKRSMCNGYTDIIRISYNFQSLCQALDCIGNENDVRFYVTVADYSNSIEQLKGIKNHSFASEEEYISYLTLKRKAFAYENELRIFVVGNQLNFDKNGVLKLKLPKGDGGMYEAITLPPIKPFSREQAKYDYYSELQFIENLNLRRELEKIFPSGNIHQCRLYEIKESTLERKYKRNMKKNKTTP